MQDLRERSVAERVIGKVANIRRSLPAETVT